MPSSLQKRLSLYSVVIIIIGMAVMDGMYERRNFTPTSNLIIADFANYATGVTHTNDTSLYARDSLWHSGKMRELLWSSSGLYMFINQSILYQINGDNFGWSEITLRIMVKSLFIYKLDGTMVKGFDHFHAPITWNTSGQGRGVYYIGGVTNT